MGREKYYTDMGIVISKKTDVLGSVDSDDNYSPWAARRAVQEKLNKAREERSEGGSPESSNARELHQQYQEALVGESAVATATE